MLDMQISWTQQDVMDHGQKIGSIPKVELGSYTVPPVEERRRIMREQRKIPADQRFGMMQQLVYIGLLDKWGMFMDLASKTQNKKMQLLIKKELWWLYQRYHGVVPGENVEGLASQKLYNRRDNMLSEWLKKGQKDQLVGVLMDAETRYRQDELMAAETRSFLGVGIALAVTALRKNEKQPSNKTIISRVSQLAAGRA